MKRGILFLFWGREGKYFFFEHVRRAIEWLKMEEMMMEKRLLL